MICPRCEERLFLVEKSELSFGQCLRCSGLFLDRGAVRFVTSSPERAKDAARSLDGIPPSVKLPMRFIKCPQCRRLMNRLNFGCTSGVLVNVCLDHGTWFDAGGLARVLEFVAEGRLAEVLEEERRELEEGLRSFFQVERGREGGDGCDFFET